MKRQEQFAYLEERLCHLCNYIQYCNFNNYTDINRISEGFIRNIINIVYGYNCKDLQRILNMNVRKLYLYMQDKAHMVKVNDKEAIYVDCGDDILQGDE